MIKRNVVFIIFTFFVLLSSFVGQAPSYLDTQSENFFVENNQLMLTGDMNEEELEQELEDTIGEQIGSVDFNGLQDILDSLSSDAQNLFGSSSFFDKITRLLSGDFNADYGSFFQSLIGIFFEEIIGLVPLLATIVIITLLCSLIKSVRSKENENSVGQIIDFVAFGIVVVLVSSVIISIFTNSADLIGSMQTQMSILFPILLTFLASVGGVVSVGIFQPAVAILSNIVVQIFNIVIIPLFVFLFIFIIVNNLSSNVKLNKFISLIQSVLKWIAGICFSVFLGILAFHGIVAGSFDSVSIRATRLAIKSYVPVLGSYISDGFNIVCASSVLIKNVVGVAGIFLLFASILTPVFQILACSMLLRLTASILEPIGETRIPDFLQQIAKTLNLLIMMILGVAFMYVITIGLILCTANIF